MAAKELDPIVLPSDHNIFVTLRRSKVDANPWQGYGPLADDGEEDAEGEGEDDEGEEDMGVEDEVEVVETELSIEDDTGAPSMVQNEEEPEPLDGEEASTLLSWSDSMMADVEHVCSADGKRLFSLYMAIHVSIARSWEKEDRDWGIDQPWISSGLKAQTRQKLLDDGGILLKNVSGFGEKMFRDGLFAIGVSRPQRVWLTYRFYLYCIQISSLKLSYGIFKQISRSSCP